MTERDLSTLLRSHVADEPPFADGGAGAVVGRGRRLVRRRRMRVGAGGIVACTLVAVLALPHLVGSQGQSDRVVDPEVANALDDYDVTTMPQTMDESAREILGSSISDLGSPDFIAFDAQFQRLPYEYWDKASGLFVRYDVDETHQITVLLNYSRSAAEGDHYRTCDRDQRATTPSLYLDCSVLTAYGTDTPVVSTLEADTMRPRNESLTGWKDQFTVVPRDSLAAVPANELWFRRAVKVVKSGTFVTVVTEEVRAPDEATARDRLRVPVEDLVRIGLDPVLVIPKPPPGDDGCPQWTMPTTQVSCGDFGQQ
jgi:hypothetical protein